MENVTSELPHTWSETLNYNAEYMVQLLRFLQKLNQESQFWGINTRLLGDWFPTFWRSVLPSPITVKRSWNHSLLNMKEHILYNIGNHSPADTSQPRGPNYWIYGITAKQKKTHQSYFSVTTNKAKSYTSCIFHWPCVREI